MEFVDEIKGEKEGTEEVHDLMAEKIEGLSLEEEEKEGNINAESPVIVRYCPVCSLPPEYCEFNPPEVFEKCLPWILENCREVLPRSILAKALGEEVETAEDESEGVSYSLLRL